MNLFINPCQLTIYNSLLRSIFDARGEAMASHNHEAAQDEDAAGKLRQRDLLSEEQRPADQRDDGHQIAKDRRVRRPHVLDGCIPEGHRDAGRESSRKENRQPDPAVDPVPVNRVEIGQAEGVEKRQSEEQAEKGNADGRDVARQRLVEGGVGSPEDGRHHDNDVAEVGVVADVDLL